MGMRLGDTGSQAGRSEARARSIDKTGKVVITPRYQQIYPFTEGLAGVELNGRWGFIDRRGTLVIPIQFTEALPFVGGLAAVNVGLCPKGWGFIDRKGRFAIPARFDDVTLQGFLPFEKGIAKVKSDSGWGCITKSGEGVECSGEEPLVVDRTSNWDGSFRVHCGQ